MHLYLPAAGQTMDKLDDSRILKAWPRMSSSFLIGALAYMGNGEYTSSAMLTT